MKDHANMGAATGLQLVFQSETADLELITSLGTDYLSSCGVTADAPGVLHAVGNTTLGAAYGMTRDSGLKLVRFKGEAFSLTTAFMGHHIVGVVVVLDKGHDASRVGEFILSAGGATGFTQGRLFDAEYDYWENERSPKKFQQAGRTLAGRRVYQHPALRRSEVDTSLNKGRVAPGNGFSESLGHLMWVSDVFLERAMLKKADLEHLGAQAVASNMWKLELSDRPFSDSNPPSDELRRKLFPANYK